MNSKYQETRKKPTNRDFTYFCRRRAGVDLYTSRLVMQLWSQFMVASLIAGHCVVHRAVGTFKLTKRRMGRINQFIRAGGKTYNVTMPPYAIYVTFKASPKLKTAIKKQFNPHP